tara:strand:- start:3942 stop:4364 length:423 start_codon:yes stop_codon:yes gene_type:complete
MKLQIIQDQSEAIEGYKSVLATNFMPPNVDDVIDNSCETISIGDTLDLYPVEFRTKVLSPILKKLRLNGEFFFSGTEPRALSKMYINNLIGTETFSKVIGSTNSVLEIDKAISLVEQVGLSIETSTINGYKYEIRSRRIA